MSKVLKILGNTLSRLPTQVKIYLHYEFISSKREKFRYKENIFLGLNLVMKNVRTNPSLRAFFKNNALS
jgi:hypothetical protein